MSTELEQLREQVERLAGTVNKHFPDDVEADKPADLAPTPWKKVGDNQIRDANGTLLFYYTVTGATDEVARDKLLRAVNSHDELVEALLGVASSHSHCACDDCIAARVALEKLAP